MRVRNSIFSWMVFAVGLFLCRPVHCHAADTADVSLVTDAAPSAPASHGAGKLLLALQDKKISVQQADSLDGATGKMLVIAGVVGKHGPVETLLKASNHPLPQSPEGLVIFKTDYHGRPAWVIAGSDDRGLMYAELDIADRIGWSTKPGSPFSEVRDITESAAVKTRGITLFTMNRAYWESRFYDEAYWTRYLDNLAKNRFNSIVLIFGYENGGFLAPCYPYFFDTDGFSGVRMVGITPEQQQRNLKALNRLIQMSHNRGLKVTIGIWDHIYRFNVQAGGTPGYADAIQHPTPGLVWGMNDDNLVPYTRAALTQFLKVVPNIDGIQFRMHDESGLKPTEQEEFWREIFALMKAKAPNIKLDLRVKGLPDAVIQDCLDTGLNFQLSTKCWMEQMGLPFHPTHVNVVDQLNRRHGYADLLRYPQRYKMNWQLWNGGTARILLWGDPEFARRFVDSTRLYDGDGFEIDEPLGTKMEGQPHDMRPFDLLGAPYRYYDYEFERYWHYFQVFGRVGYNPAAPTEIWDREFQQRFGEAAAPHVEKALHTASWILPRIVASDYPYGAFPMTGGWAEKQHFGDLPSFARDQGSDIQQFENFDDEAKRLIENGETPKIRPQENSLWFAQTAAAVNAEITSAEQAIGDHRNKEFNSTILDLRILANLALYHSRRAPAAVSYRIFIRTKDSRALDDAIAAERSAIEAWKQIVDAAGDVYAPDLMMGARSRNLCGHWRDELAALEKGLVALQRERKAISPAASQPTVSNGFTDYRYERPALKFDAIATARAGAPIVITAEAHATSGIKWIRLRYRSVDQYLDYKTLPMQPTGREGQYEATIPAADIPSTWDLMYFLEVMDDRGNGAIYPDLNNATPYVVVHLAR
jgi:hypothetical protein